MIKRERFVAALPALPALLALLVVLAAPAADLAAHAGGAEGSAAAKLLTGIESRIMAAQGQAFARGDVSALDQLSEELDSLDVPAGSTLGYYKNYWRAYILYLRSLALARTGDLEETKKSVHAAIDILKATEPKDAEILALLASASGLSLRFEPPQRVPALGALTGKYAAEALKADPNNIRALYVNAVSDWNTPRQYGGGKRAEDLARRCVKQPQPEMGQGLAPTWGRDLCFALLIQILLQEGKTEEARALVAQGKQEYPSNPVFAQLERRLPADTK